MTSAAARSAIRSTARSHDRLAAWVGRAAPCTPWPRRWCSRWSGCGGAVAAWSPWSAKGISMRCWRVRRHSCPATGTSISCSAPATCCRHSSSGRLRVGFLISPSVDGELGGDDHPACRRRCDPRILLAYRRLGAEGLLRGSDARSGVAGHQSRRASGTGASSSSPARCCWRSCRAEPMLPMAYAASRAWLIHWDRFVLPMPGCRASPSRSVPRSRCPGYSTRRPWKAPRVRWNA